MDKLGEFPKWGPLGRSLVNQYPVLSVNSAARSALSELVSFEVQVPYKLAYIQFVYFYVGFLCRAVQRNSLEHHDMIVSTAFALSWNIPQIGDF